MTEFTSRTHSDTEGSTVKKEKKLWEKQEKLWTTRIFVIFCFFFANNGPMVPAIKQGRRSQINSKSKTYGSVGSPSIKEGVDILLNPVCANLRFFPTRRRVHTRFSLCLRLVSLANIHALVPLHLPVRCYMLTPSTYIYG